MISGRRVVITANRPYELAIRSGARAFWSTTTSPGIGASGQTASSISPPSRARAPSRRRATTIRRGKRPARCRTTSSARRRRGRLAGSEPCPHDLQPVPVPIIQQRQAEDDREQVEEPVVARGRDQDLEQHQAHEASQPDRPGPEDEERGDQLGVEHEPDRQPVEAWREAGGCTSSSRSAAAGSGSGTRAPVQAHQDGSPLASLTTPDRNISRKTSQRTQPDGEPPGLVAGLVQPEAPGSQENRQEPGLQQQRSH